MTIRMSCLILVVLMGSAHALGGIEHTWQTDPADPGWTRWTLHLQSDLGPITSVDIRLFPEAGAAFRQPMAHLEDPSVWADSISDAQYASEGVLKAWESHFLFDESAVSVLDVSGLRDDGSELAAAFALPGDGSTTVAVAQVLMRDTVTISPRIAGTQGPAQITVWGKETHALEDIPPGERVLAHAGGPYVVYPGQTLQLDASLSEDRGLPPSSWQWDLDGGVGGFDDASGEVVDLSYAYLTGECGMVHGEYPVRVLVNGYGMGDVAETTLTIMPDPAGGGILLLAWAVFVRKTR